MSLVDLALWGLVALIVQWLAHQAIHLLIRDLATQIEGYNRAVAIFAAVIAVAVGLVNAAAMTW